MRNKQNIGCGLNAKNAVIFAAAEAILTCCRGKDHSHWGNRKRRPGAGNYRMSRPLKGENEDRKGSNSRQGTSLGKSLEVG